MSNSGKNGVPSNTATDTSSSDNLDDKNFRTVVVTKRHHDLSLDEWKLLAKHFFNLDEDAKLTKIASTFKSRAKVLKPYQEYPIPGPGILIIFGGSLQLRQKDCPADSREKYVEMCKNSIVGIDETFAYNITAAGNGAIVYQMDLNILKTMLASNSDSFFIFTMRHLRSIIGLLGSEDDSKSKLIRDLQTTVKKQRQIIDELKAAEEAKPAAAPAPGEGDLKETIEKLEKVFSAFAYHSVQGKKVIDELKRRK